MDGWMDGMEGVLSVLFLDLPAVGVLGRTKNEERGDFPSGRRKNTLRLNCGTC